MAPVTSAKADQHESGPARKRTSAKADQHGQSGPACLPGLAALAPAIDRRRPPSTPQIPLHRQNGLMQHRPVIIRNTAAVTQDLETLKAVLESR